VLIYPRPSEFCGYCKIKKPCTCKCHDLDLINSKHHEIHIEEQEFIVKPVIDLEHFRP